MTLPDAVRSVRWHLRMAARIPEPRVVRTFYFACYLVLLVGAVSCLLRPLSSWEGTFGLTVTYAWAAILAIGSLVGAASVFTIYWAVERIGLYLAGGGLFVYAAVTFAMHITSDQGNRIPQTTVIVCVLLMLVLRFVRIRGAIVEPGK